MSYHENLEQLSIKIAFSPKCNFRCDYCGGSEDRENISIPAAMEDYRAEHISTGCISTDQVLNLLKAFHDNGFVSVRPTGGEPMLRPDWDNLVSSLSRIGYRGIDITTNGILLSHYLNTHEGKLPQGLSTLKVSLDTYDAKEFKKITKGGDLYKVVDGITKVTEQTWVRANTVILRSNSTPEKIKGLVDFCRNLGMKQIQFLDLVYYSNLPNANSELWEKEFVAWPEFERIFKQVYTDVVFTEPSNQFGVNFHRAELNDGFVITFKDSTSTMRNPSCESCQTYCQEGRCLIRVGTDGNVTFCPDYKAELWHFNGMDALNKGNLNFEIDKIASIVESSIKKRTIEIFAQKHNLKLPNEI